MNQNQDRKDRKERPKIEKHVFFAILAAIYVFIYIISNRDSITSWGDRIVSILSPVLIGAAISYLCAPILRFLERRPLHKIKNFSVRRLLSITLTFLFILLIIGAMGLLIIPQLTDSVGELIAQYDNYIANAVTYVNQLINKIMQHLPSADPNVPQQDLISIEKVQDTLQSLITGTDAIIDVVVSRVSSFATSLVSALSDIILALFISFYLLASKEKRLAQAKKIVSALFSENKTKFIYETVSLADRTFGKYLEGKIIDSFLVGIICYIVFSIFGIPYAEITSTFIGVANIIPFFGPIIGAIPSGFIIFIANPSKLLLFAILTLIIMQIDGNVIEPRVLGNTTGVSSLCIIVAISVMGNMWGVFGMVVGVPFAAVIVALSQRYINAKLKKRGLSDDLDDYYDDSDSEEEPDTPRISYRYYFAMLQYKWKTFWYWIRRKKSSLPPPDKKMFQISPLSVSDEDDISSEDTAIESEENTEGDVSESSDPSNDEAFLDEVVSQEDISSKEPTHSEKNKKKH